MDNIKVKLYGLFKVNRKQFLWVYACCGTVFLSLTIIFAFYHPHIPENANMFSRFLYQNSSYFWFTFFSWSIIEGQFYWTKFVKVQLKIIEKQKTEIEKHKDAIAAKNQQITDSISYASRIQKSLLPNHNIFEDCLQDFFIFYKPRDIVSGDFYWIRELNGILIIVAADCTGHGVPGAFMSMLGLSYLKEITDKYQNSTNEVTPGRIAESLRENVKHNLDESNDISSTKDGMDIAISVVNRKLGKLYFTGANNPLYLIRNDELIKYKGTPNPIGVYLKEIPFAVTEIDMVENDQYYMFSDGFIDQFGGPANKKFTAKKLRQLLLDVHKRPMQEQKETIGQTFENWKGKYEQVDDVLILGFKI